MFSGRLIPRRFGEGQGLSDLRSSHSDAPPLPPQILTRTTPTRVLCNVLAFYCGMNDCEDGRERRKPDRNGLSAIPPAFRGVASGHKILIFLRPRGGA